MTRGLSESNEVNSPTRRQVPHRALSEELVVKDGQLTVKNALITLVSPRTQALSDDLIPQRQVVPPVGFFVGESSRDEEVSEIDFTNPLKLAAFTEEVKQLTARHNVIKHVQHNLAGPENELSSNESDRTLVSSESEEGKLLENNGTARVDRTAQGIGLLVTEKDPARDTRIQRPVAVRELATNIGQTKEDVKMREGARVSDALLSSTKGKQVNNNVSDLSRCYSFVIYYET